MLSQTVPRHTTRYEEAVANIREMVSLNRLDMKDLTIPQVWAAITRIPFYYKIEADKDLVHFSYYTDPAQIKAIDDAVRMVARMCPPAAHLNLVDTR
jgi:hypothetical protein